MPFKIFDGSSWLPSKKIKVQTQSGLQDYKKAFIFNGTSWVEVVEIPKKLTDPELSYSKGDIIKGVGQTVSSTNGTWEGNPTSYKYKWEKGIYSGSQILWSEIPDSNTNSLLLTGEMVGYKIRCSVIAVNSAGDSEKAYGTSASIMLPQFIDSITAFVQDENGKIRIFWPVSEGADGYEIIWQGPLIPRTEKTNVGKLNNLYDHDFGANNVNDLIGLTTLGIYVAPYNNTSPAVAAFNQANGISGPKLQALYYQSKDILDLLPYKPTVTASAVATNPYSYETAIQISWTNSRITQTSYSVEYQYYNEETLEYGWAPYRTGTTDQSAYLSIGPGYSFDGLRVVVTGTSRGFAGPFIGISNSPTALNIIPTVYSNPTLTPTGEVLAGTLLTANQGSWENVAGATYSIVINKNGSQVASGTTSATYTTTQADQDAEAVFIAVATASNSAGTSLPASSNSVTCRTNSTIPTGGIARIYGSGTVGTQITMGTDSWATGTATPSSYSQTLQRMNSVGTYEDMGVTSYTVQSSDLSVGSKGGTTAAIFRAKVVATNSAGSTTVYSDYVQAASNTFIVPQFIGGGVPQSTGQYTISDAGGTYSTSTLSLAGTVAAQSPESGTSAVIGSTITVYQYYYVAPSVLASGGVASISGSGQVGTTLTASASGWSGSPTPTVTTQLQRMNYAGGYDDMGVTSYTVQSSDLSVGTKGGAIAALFRTISRATNSAGTAEVWSDYVQASAAPVAPSFPYFPTFTAPAPSFPYFPTFTAPAPSFPYFPAFKGPSFPTFTAPVAPSFPYFPTFTAPVSPSFPYFKVTKCIEANTRLLTLDRGYVAVKDIQLGDKLISIAAEDFGNESMQWFNIKNNVKITEVEVIKSELSVKDVLSFNGMEKYFSYGQPIFIKKDGLATWVETGKVKIGDTLLELDPGTGDINEVIVNSIETDIDKEVYDIRTAGNQWFIAEQFIVIS